MPGYCSPPTRSGCGWQSSTRSAPTVTRGADGADGAELHLGGRVHHVPAAVPPGPVIDTNGAGDAFAAGIVAARARGATWAEAAGYAARVAAAACTHDGMEYPPGLLPLP
ncbi:PfkB family carbohydrate kinase [Verrucosispora sp. TAA-831]|uniref:PfkB family carbohydrate kinase n=1 Tax=Verrucosispora sp. TAA-831 TaxID=3422227 RepID=UPI003D6EC34A